MGAWSELLKEFGPWGVMLIVGVYILLKSSFTISYPRDKKSKKN